MIFQASEFHFALVLGISNFNVTTIEICLNLY